MRAWWWFALFGMVGCSGDGSGDGTTQLQDDDDDVGDDDDDDGPWPGGTGLPSVFDLMRDDAHYCESQAAYNPSVPTSSTHWFGEYHYDANGVVTGYEIAMLYANEKLASDWGGVTDCVVVWEAEGEVDEAVVGGTDLGLAVNLVIDVVQTTCDPNPFEDDVGAVHYNVAITGESSIWYFDSQTEFAAGYGDDDYASWFYDSCQLF
jgi:hypothetical protein